MLLNMPGLNMGLNMLIIYAPKYAFTKYDLNMLIIYGPKYASLK